MSMALPRNIELLSKMYDCDLSRKTFIVKLSINHYSNVFNGLDPAPMRKRDVDVAVVNYLEDCSTDIPLKYKLVLQLNAPAAIQDSEKEERVRSGLKTFFSFVMLSLRRDLRSSYGKSLVWIITSISLLSLSFFLGSKMHHSIIVDTMIEGLSIGGWVFLWEAIALVIFKNRDVIKKYKKYDRLEKAPITFSYYDD